MKCKLDLWVEAAVLFVVERYNGVTQDFIVDFLTYTAVKNDVWIRMSDASRRALVGYKLNAFSRKRKIIKIDRRSYKAYYILNPNR